MLLTAAATSGWRRATRSIIRFSIAVRVLSSEVIPIRVRTSAMISPKQRFCGDNMSYAIVGEAVRLVWPSSIFLVAADSLFGRRKRGWRLCVIPFAVAFCRARFPSAISSSAALRTNRRIRPCCRACIRKRPGLLPIQSGGQSRNKCRSPPWSPGRLRGYGCPP